jgi:hypothetical protein
MGGPSPARGDRDDRCAAGVVTIYVDDMRMPATVGRITARWSHLMADTDEELHAFAAALGLRRSWAQFPGTWKSHYDVTDAKRQQAISRGARPITHGGAESAALIAGRLAEAGRRGAKQGDQ